MKRFNVFIISLSIFGTLFLTSCEEPENQILGLWLFDSLEQTVTEDGELTATATQYYSEDESFRWEFQEMELLFYEGEELELEETYSWVIENGETLILSRERSDDIEFEIITLTRKVLVLMDEEYRADGNKLTVIEKIYNLTREEE